MDEGQDRIIEEPGERSTTKKYFYRGYWYHKEVRAQAGLFFQIYRCATRTVVRCPGMLRSNTVTHVIEEVSHNHGSNTLALLVHRLKLALKNEAREARGPISLRRIFDSVCMR